MLPSTSILQSCRETKCKSENIKANIKGSKINQEYAKKNQVLLEKLKKEKITLKQYMNSVKEQMFKIFSSKEQEILNKCLVNNCNNDIKKMFKELENNMNKSCKKNDKLCLKNIKELFISIKKSEIKIDEYKKTLKLLYTHLIK